VAPVPFVGRLRLARALAARDELIEPLEVGPSGVGTTHVAVGEHLLAAVVGRAQLEVAGDRRLLVADLEAVRVAQRLRAVPLLVLQLQLLDDAAVAAHPPPETGVALLVQTAAPIRDVVLGGRTVETVAVERWHEGDQTSFVSRPGRELGTPGLAALSM